MEKSYTYDAIGNITFKSDVGTYQYTDLNHKHAVTSAGGNTYSYDANGNMLNGAGRTHTWTSFNKPAGIWTANGYTGFGYDANHNRISKTTPTSKTVYVGKIFEQTTMGGLIKNSSHVYAGSKLIASIEDAAGVPSIHYMHGDHLGSISVITDGAGAVAERLRFDAFGAPVNLNGSKKANIGASNTTRGYTGHEMDASTGLINMNARLYDPVLGRFISADTVVPGAGNMQAFNRYAYVDNNPLVYTDPSGHFKLKNLWREVRNTYVKFHVLSASVTLMAAGVMTGNPALIAAGYGIFQGYRGYYVHDMPIAGAMMYGGIKGFEAYGYLNMAYGGAGAYGKAGAQGLMKWGMKEAAIRVGQRQAYDFGKNHMNLTGTRLAVYSYLTSHWIRNGGKIYDNLNQIGKFKSEDFVLHAAGDYSAGIGPNAKVWPDDNVKVLEDFGDMATTAATGLSVAAPPFAVPFTFIGIMLHGSAYYMGGNGNSSYIDAIMFGVDKGLDGLGVTGRAKGVIGGAEGYIINGAGSE